ncbi:MAG TPA: hypothetical protein VG146_14705 [Verrucomicrobiae bacterium]|nr:hypothetical protein [Verrucomicrobiae bacterium]
MNKLKKLFSPSTLAATVATGLLAASAVNALASELVSACSFGQPGCPSSCARVCNDPSFVYYWCCGSTETCGSYAPYDGGKNGCEAPGAGCGWCL